jgi:hypothetical protein
VKPSLPETIYSPEQVEALIMELEQYLAARQRQRTKRKVGAKGADKLPELKPELADILGSATIAAKAPEAQLDKLMEALKAWRVAPVVHITFPVLPPDSLKHELVKWFRSQITTKILVQFSVNHTLVGGMVVRTTGKIFDWSLKRQLLDHKDKLPEIFNRV